MRNYENDDIVMLVSRTLSPFIMLFALYVIFHGHYSPGGGFQGGTMLAAAVILIRLAAGEDIAQLQFPRAFALPLGAAGVLIYFGTGVAAMIGGGPFLDYAHLPFAGTTAALRSLGILLVEVGVGLAVVGILVSIYDNILEADEQ